ncbi:hypothetical protein [Paenibacillus protaetiae]|uniref:hypothetical protein n=1 Tax=Paenibacillus protaetiae TaxID=2509456 RepID=UPI001FCA2776|nr:hypothetical protein [Paenibacillus protaetiae]
MEQFPVVTAELAERLEQSETEYMVSRVNAIREREGNPEGAEIMQFGGATAFYVRTMPWGTFNTVKGLTADDVEHVDDMIQFYRERDRSCQFEIIPSKASPKLLQVLASKGFHQQGFHTTMYGLPAAAAPSTRQTSLYAKFRRMSLRYMESCTAWGPDCRKAALRMLPPTMKCCITARAGGYFLGSWMERQPVQL